MRPDNPREKHDNPMVNQLAEVLAQGTRAGAWSVEATQFTALLLFHSLHGALDEALADTGEVNRKRLCRALEVFFQRAVGVV